MVTTVIKIVASAFISGFKPRRTREKTTNGKVVEPGPDKKDDNTRSSSDNPRKRPMRASTKPAQVPMATDAKAVSAAIRNDSHAAASSSSSCSSA
ncbi:hypothetical protein BGZ96_007722 [Linnemannia gamsii]|uniref:Uncharacterized protein n=1 Tax=Linnemannia gamsii TaxID=64522 RepID=A0ABQ7K098_9FUNG|nr:hypothetical protein BGZ96_007722 [Linnemannia gamsii]